MKTAVKQPPAYALGHSQEEMERLIRQSQVFTPFTRQLFEEAGITSGMRVLDVGCGAGDVTFLAAELVGPTGTVMAADLSAAAIECATRRAHERSSVNVEFVHGDPTLMKFDRQFDAVVGRFVLMYCRDPKSALSQLASHVRPGGIVAFQEFDMKHMCSFPAAPTFERAAEWMRRALRASGTLIHMGLELYSMFLSSGLPEPSLRWDTLIGGAAHFPLEILAATVQNLLPVLEKFSIASAREVEVETLARRMREEMVVRKAIATSPALIGAWARKPA